MTTPFVRPRECGLSNEDLECLGCGDKLGYLREKGICGAEEAHKRRMVEQELKERAELKRLQGKYGK